jgi:cellulose biosynthesis protein BcsQ
MNFDEAYALALAEAKHLGETTGCPVYILRDLKGRLRLVLEGTPAPEITKDASDRLGTALSYYASRISPVVAPVEAFSDPAAILNDPGVLLVGQVGDAKIRLVERTITGADWSRAPVPSNSTSKRATFFGVKGGLGRTTAAAVSAWKLANEGYRVVLVDLDLESPGLSSTFLPSEATPTFGLVDYLIEDQFGHANDLLPNLGAESPLSRNSTGKIFIVPAFGATHSNNDYLSKLSRVYLEAEDEAGKPLTFGERLSKAIDAIESQFQPDVLFLDSRSGIHDIAAAAVTRLNATALLFAGPTPQCWIGYDFLLRRWAQSPALSFVRDRLKVVAALVPEQRSSESFEKVLSRSFRCFESVYDFVEPNAERPLDAFNYAFDDEAAPHFPLRINWSGGMSQFDPTGDPNALTEPQIDSAFSAFVSGLKVSLDLD